MKIYLNFLFLILGLHLTAQQTDQVLNLENQQELDGRKTYVFIDTSNHCEINQVDAPDFREHFEFHDNKDINFGFEPNTIWLRFKINNPSAYNDYVLVLYLSSLDYVNLFAKDSSGFWQKTEMGDRLPFKNRIVKNRFFVFPLDFSHASIQTFYVQAQTKASAQLPIKILRKDAFTSETIQSEMGYGFFYGMLGVMILFNLFLYFSLRDKAYLFYVFNVVATFVFVLSLTGHHNVFLLQNAPLLANYCLPLSAILLLLTSSAFLLFFLRVDEYGGRSKYMVYFLMALAVVLLFSSAFLDYGKLTKIINVVGFASSLLNFSIAAICWKRGNPSAKYYLLAFCSYVTGIVVIVLRNEGFLSFNILTMHSIELGSSIELILLSLALSEKFNRYRKEKEAAIKENLQIQKEANETLEANVFERTSQLRAANQALNETLDLVKIERQKSDKLLLNILPVDTAKELKETGTAIPKHFNMATVLFTDFKDFTRLTSKITPEEVVAQLNTCFSAFDEICKKYKLEKIKTIGDSYMCVGGLPTANKTNPADAVSAGLEMQKWVQKWGNEQKKLGKAPWSVRIGLHTGEVVAGVVGKDKFAYDVWGDTVNLASRMERHGDIGKVNISDATYKQVKNIYSCTQRGRIKVKNMGEVEMYFVEN